MAILPELMLLAGALAFFVLSLGQAPNANTVRRTAIITGWATLVAAEMLAASSGLGYMILMGRQFARPDIIILGIVVIGSIGVLLTYTLSLVEQKVLGWKKL